MWQKSRFQDVVYACRVFFELRSLSLFIVLLFRVFFELRALSLVIVPLFHIFP